jgi:hypothetical protein
VFFLMLSSIKSRLDGYSTPSIVADTDESGQVHHSVNIVTRWIKGLESLGLDKDFIRDTDVLELGPGSNLGAGAALLAMGARSYTAYDRFPLVKAQSTFYDQLLAEVQRVFKLKTDKDQLLCRLDYIVDPNFDFAPLRAGSRRFSLIVSNAAFEHFDNCEDVISNVSLVANSSAVFVAWVDFKTHSRWIRSVDPNNIYRYSSWLYDRFGFPGQPNRLRPRDYIEMLNARSWQASLGHCVRAPVQYNVRTDAYLSPRFRNSAAEMSVMSGAILARRSDGAPRAMPSKS